MVVEMEPQICSSVRERANKTWSLGSRVILEESSKPSPVAIAHWSDENSRVFSLRSMTAGEAAEGPSDKGEEEHRVELLGTCYGVWNLGGALIKVESWRQGMQVEANTIERVRSIVSPVQVPEVIHTWVDEAWERTFLVMKPLRGSRMDDVWEELSEAQRHQIADEAAQMTAKLARITSNRLESVDGLATLEGWLASQREDRWSQPAWIPTFLGPLSNKDLGSLGLAKYGGDFHLYNANLSSVNTFVENGRLTGVQDWRGTGFFPRFFIASKVVTAGQFLLEWYGLNRTPQELRSWSLTFAKHLAQHGFEADGAAFKDWFIKMGWEEVDEGHEDYVRFIGPLDGSER